MSSRESFYVDSEGPNKEAVVKGLKWLLENADDVAYIAVMGYGNLVGYVAEILGERAIKDLTKKDGAIRVNGTTITLITQKRKIWSGNGRPILAFYPSSKFLDVLDSIPDVSALCVVPWMKPEVEPWMITHNAQSVNGEKSQPIKTIENGVVVEALKTLTALANVSTGISHSSDRETVVQIFIKLRDAGEYYNPEEVKTWLIRNGWKATDAQEVADISQKILERKPLRRGKNKFRRGIVNRWRKAAASSKESES